MEYGVSHERMCLFCDHFWSQPGASVCTHPDAEGRPRTLEHAGTSERPDWCPIDNQDRKFDGAEDNPAIPDRYELIAQEIAALVIEKQKAYGDSFGKTGAVMRILYPEGIKPEQMDDALTVVRVLDKLFRIATDRDALGESPWQDLAGYSLLALGRVG